MFKQIKLTKIDFNLQDSKVSYKDESYVCKPTNITYADSLLNIDAITERVKNRE